MWLTPGRASGRKTRKNSAPIIFITPPEEGMLWRESPTPSANGL